MNKVLALALNTFREAIRNKVLYSLLFFAVILIFGALAFGSLSIRDHARLTTDLGVAAMSLFSIVIAIFVGVNMVYKELERKTIYTLIPKPIHRYQFVVGKYLGLVLTLIVQLLVMSATLVVVLKLRDAEVGVAVLMMVLLILLEVVVITAVAVLFSSFSTPFLSGLFTAGIFLLGRSVPEIRLVATKVSEEAPALGTLLDGIAAVVPNLRYFFVSGTSVAGEHVSINGLFVDWAYLGNATLYAGLYVALILIFACVFFSRRDFI